MGLMLPHPRFTASPVTSIVKLALRTLPIARPVEFQLMESLFTCWTQLKLVSHLALPLNMETIPLILVTNVIAPARLAKVLELVNA